MDFDLEGARKAGYSDAEIATGLASKMEFDLKGARDAGYSDKEIVDNLLAKPKASDYVKSVAAGALSGAGAIPQGAAELLTRGVNAVAGTELRAENLFKGAIDWLNESQSVGAKRAVADSQITGNLFDPSTYDFGKNPSVAGIALQGLNAIGQFAPNLAIAIGTAGASVPAQLAIGATVGGMQALGGGAEEERHRFEAMGHEDLMASSTLYRELIDKKVAPATAKAAVAEAAALGGGLGNAIPSAAEGAFENFLVGALTRGRIRLPGSNLATKTIGGAAGGAALGGSEEAIEQMGQNIGSNLAIGGNRPVTQDTLQQFVMGALAEGTAGAGAGALQHTMSPERTNEETTGKAIRDISAAKTADEAIAAATAAAAAPVAVVDPVTDVDLSQSISGGIISSAMEGAIPRAERIAREEPAYQQLEQQRAGDLDRMEQERARTAQAREQEIERLAEEDRVRASTGKLASRVAASDGDGIIAQAMRDATGLKAPAAQPDWGRIIWERMEAREAAKSGVNTDVNTSVNTGGVTDAMFAAALTPARETKRTAAPVALEQAATVASAETATPPAASAPATSIATETGTIAPTLGTAQTAPAAAGVLKDSTIMPNAGTVDTAAHAAAISPKNDLPEPTKGQILGGNAKLGHPKVAGMDLSIENPAGSVREDKNNTPPKWRTEMKSHYGYVKGTVGFDKDHVDVFVKPGTAENWHGTVYVVNQNKANGHLDEHKAMVGFSSEKEAREGYLANYEKGWEKNIRSIAPYPLEYFKTWAYDKTTRGPKGGEAKSVLIMGKRPDQLTRKMLEAAAKGAKTGAQRAIAQAELDRRDIERDNKPLSDAEQKRRERLSKTARAKRVIDTDRDSIVAAIIKSGGLNVKERADILRDRSGNTGIPGVGYLFTKGGLGIDDMATSLAQDGYMTPAEMEDVDGGVQALRDKIADEFEGTKKHWAMGSTAAARELDEAYKSEQELAEEADKAARSLDAEIDLTVTAEDLAEDGIEPTGGNLARQELLDRLAEIDPDALEDLSTRMQDATDDAFMAAVVAKLKEKTDGQTQRSDEADGGARPAQEATAASAPEVKPGTAPEHAHNVGKKLDESTVYEPAAAGNPATTEAELPEDVQTLTMGEDDFKQLTDEWAKLFEAPGKKVITGKGLAFITKAEADKLVAGWKDAARSQAENDEIRRENSKKTILSLFDYTGEWSKPWREAGYNVITFDIQTGQDVHDFSVEYFTDNWDISEVYGILAACPCTDFAVSGARHFAGKDADGRTEASKELVFQTMKTIEYFRPKFWVLENPVGRIERLTGLPPARMTFDPSNFGETYTKKTVLWGHFNPELPTANVEPVEGSKMWAKYGGKSQATKNARSVTPEGFAYAFFMANNFAGRTPEDRLTAEYPEASGAVKAALRAGVTEERINELMEYTYGNYEYDKAREALVKEVYKLKGGKTKAPTKEELEAGFERSGRDAFKANISRDRYPGEGHAKPNETRAWLRGWDAERAATPIGGAKELPKATDAIPAALAGFVDGMTPMQKGKIVDTLSRQMSFNGTVKSRLEGVRDSVQAGATITQGSEGRRLTKPDGAYLGEDQLGKTAMDYAAHLIAQRPSLELETQSEADLKAKADAEAAAEKAKADEEAAVEAKRKADADRDSFGLTGSTRAADANPGQADIFAQPAAPASPMVAAADAMIQAANALKAAVSPAAETTPENDGSKSGVAYRDSFSVERIVNGEPSVIYFNRGEYVRAMTVVGENSKWAEGEVTGISRAEKKAKVGEQWFEFGRIYKAERPAVETKPTQPLSKTVAQSNARNEPAGGFSASDKVGFATRGVHSILRDGGASAKSFWVADLVKNGEAFPFKLNRKMTRMGDWYFDIYADGKVSNSLPFPAVKDKTTAQEAADILLDYVRTDSKDKWEIRSLGDRHQNGATAGASVPARASGSPMLDQHDAVLDRARDGELPLDEFKAAYARAAASQEEITAELSKLTKDQIERRMGNRRPGEKKDRLIRMAYEDVLSDFGLSRGISYTMGSPNGYRDAIAKMVEATTEADLAEFAERVKKSRAERAKRLEGFKDPKTLEDFDLVVRVKGTKDLTPEQMARYDELLAGAGRARRAQVQEARATVQAAGEKVGAKVIETKHTQKGHDLFVVQLEKRVDKDDYHRLNTAAKKLGGYYSSYAKGGAVPGFQFKAREQADAFHKLATEGDTQAVQEAVVERRTDRREEKKNAAAERLSAMADKMEEAANESMSRDRLANTAKRASQAAAADAQARADVAMAKTLRNLADAIEAGTATHLDGIRTKAQVEELAKLSTQAKYDRLRKQYPSSVDFERNKDRAVEVEDIAELVKSPWHFDARHEQLYHAINKFKGRPGTKMLAGQLQRLAETTRDADKWITVPRTVVEAVMEKGGSEGKYDDAAPWYWVSRMATLKRLEAAGIPDLPTLRAALREFVQYKGSQPKADRVKELERDLAGKAGVGIDFFPTPAPLAARMAEALDLQPGMSVLEPSGGKGNLADAVRTAEPGAEIDVVEQSATLREILEAKGYPLVGTDFATFEPEQQYDRIIMNPPFSNGQDADHVRRAYGMLKPGGRLVAITGEGIFFREDAKSREFREWLDKVGGTSEEMEEAFTDRREVKTTSVRSRLLIIDKPEEAMAQAAFSRAQNKFAAALDAIDRTGSVKFGFEPEWASESSRKPQKGEPMSVQTGESSGSSTRGGKWKSTDLWTYDKDGNLVGVFSMATAGSGTGAFKITTKDSARRTGVATRLLDAAEEQGIDIASSISQNRFTGDGRNLVRAWLQKKVDAGASFSRAPRYSLDPKGQPLLALEDVQLVEPQPIPGVFGFAGGTPYQSKIVQGDRVLGVAILNWKDGKVRDLLYIKTHRNLRGQGIAERVVRGILQHNDGAPLRAVMVLPKARGFWEKMGAEFVQTEEGEDGILTRENYADAQAARDDARSGSSGSGEVSRQAASRQGEGGSADPRAYRRAAGRYGTLAPEDVRRIVAPILRNWGNAPEVQVIASIADAPAAIQRLDTEQRDGGAAGEPEAFFNGGTVYLVANGLSSEAAVIRALFHESLGHYGLRGVLGDQIVTVLHDVAKAMPGRVAAKAREYGLNLEHQDAKLIAAEEVLAELAQSRPNLSFVQRAVAAVRKFLRGLGVKLDLTQNDLIADFILPARDFVTRQRQGWTGGGPSPANFERKAPIWYSELQRRVENIGMNAAPAKAWKDWLRGQQSKGLKADEIEWSGINEWLDVHATNMFLKNEKVTKAQVVDFLAQNGVKVTETTLGETAGEQQATSEKDELVVELDALGYSVNEAPDIHTEETNIDGITHRVTGYTYPVDDDGLQERLAMVRPEDLVDGEPSRQEAPALPERVRAIVNRLIELGPSLPTTEGSSTRYSKYTLPGGKNYRELLLTLPSMEKRTAREIMGEPVRVGPEEAERRHGSEANGLDHLFYPDNQYITIQPDGQYHVIVFHDELLTPDLDKAEQFLLRKFGSEISMNTADFNSAHWDQPNIVAHVRLDERIDADGKRVLFVQEFQSDWAQKGKREGFQKPDDEARMAEMTAQWHVLKSQPRTDAVQAEINRLNDAMNKIHDARNHGVPRGPFVEKTEAWAGLAIKRVIRYAAEHGFDRVAWTTGAQQADRYSLAKEVSRIEWSPRLSTGEKAVGITFHRHQGMQIFIDKDGVVTNDERGNLAGKQLADVIGKAASEKIMGARSGSLQGDGLKIGGEGMIAFYDKIVPNVANDVLKKLGGGRVVASNVVTSDLDLETVAQRVYGERYEDLPPESRKQVVVVSEKNMTAQPGFDITPAMAEKALGGLPMFSRARRAQGFPADIGAPIASLPRPYDGTVMKGHPDYAAAKAGDHAAAERYVRAMVKPETIEEARRRFGSDVIFVAPTAMEASGPNAIPDTLAAHYAHALGARMDTGITQTNRAYHTGAGRLERLASRPVFDGPVEKGAAYVLVDDVITMGGTLAELADHIREGGGTVKGVVVLADASKSGKLSPSKEDTQRLERRFGDEIRSQFQVEPAALTADETLTVDGLRDVDDLRNRAAEARQARARRVPEGQVPGSQDRVGAFSRAPAIAGSQTTGDHRDSLFATGSSFVRDLLHSDSKFNWWHRTIGTQQHKAALNREFRPVYDESQAFLADVSKYANEAADLATSLLPRIENFADFTKSSPSKADLEVVSEALYAGTLWGNGSPLNGRKWTDDELRAGRARDGDLTLPAFKPLNDAQIDLYRQTLDSVGQSLDGLAKSLIHRLARTHDIGFDREMSLEDVAQTVRDAADEQIAELLLQAELAEDSGASDKDMERIDRGLAEWERLKRGVTDIEDKTTALKDHGYFPAMRFGQFAVHIVEPDQNGVFKQLYFGLYESQTKANLAARELEREMRAAHPDMVIERGIVSKEQHRLFQGMSLDALETFAEYITGDNGEPISKDPLVQGFLKAATNERSTLKRHIHRKGIAGFSDDLPRVLASFTVSSARATSSNYHSAQMLKLAQDIRAGDVKDEAIKLVRYLQDPQEEAQAIRGFLFAQFLGGSIAHGLVNMTQPFMVTIPYLSQYTSAADAAAKVAAAAVSKPSSLTGRLKDAYERAKKEGVVAPQEIHQLRAETGGMPLAKNLALRKLSFLWGSIYAVTEQFNRSSAFIAAYRIAEEKGIRNPYAFAAKAVNETQFVYNKGNRPNWARGAVGATIFTFKQFSISYLELAKRMYAKDKKAFALMVLMLLAAAGAEGLPFAEDVEDMIDTMGQWMGYSTNSKKLLRRWAENTLGKDLAQVALHGVSGLPFMPVDVSVRMGLQNLLPGTGMLKLSEKNKGRDVLELVGPIGQFVPTEGTTLGRALERLAASDYFGVVKAGAPVAVQNVAKGAEMLNTGTARDTKGKKIGDVSPGEAVFKLAGLQPASVARESRKIGEVMQDIDLQKRQESEIAEQWARGMLDKDSDQVRDAMKKLHDWNRDNPELRIRLSMDQVRRRAQSMRTDRDTRVIKTAPPEIRGAVREALR
jgi:hypothetical protein